MRARERRNLFCAVRDGRLDDAIALLDDSGRAVSVTAADSRGVTPLLVACAADHAAVVEELLFRGADANAEDRFGRTPLSQAKSVAVVRLLLLSRARANPGDLSDVLATAAEAGQLDLVRLLLKAGADPSDAILPALKGRQEEVFRVVVAAGADVNRRRNLTILDTVLDDNDLPALRLLLLAAPRKLTLESLEDGSSLAAACSREAAELLLDAGASVHHRDATGQTPLHYVRHPAVLQLLIERGALVSATDNDGATPLHCARSADEVKFLLEHGASVHIVDRHARAPLFYAVNAEVAGALLTAGADASALDAERNTPLMYQLQQGGGSRARGEVIDALLAHTTPAAALRANSAGHTVLRLACGMSSVVDRLIALGANAAEREPATGRTLLMEANCNDVDVLATLLRGGADVHAVDNSNRTALWHAVSSGRHDVAAYLFDRDPSLLAVCDHVDGWTPLHCAVAADLSSAPRTLQLLASKATPEVLNARDKAGRTALCLAAEHRNGDAIGVLLDAGAEAGHARTADGRTALMICASWAAERWAVDLLRAANKEEDLAHVDANGQTALAIAAAAGNEWMVQRITECPDARASIDAVDNDGCTPLIRAVLGRSDGIVKALLAAGADANATDKEQCSALSHAARLGCECIVAALVAAKADVSHSGGALGYSPLLHAARGGHAGCVRTLLAAGASMLHVARDGDTALLAAAQQGHAEVIEALLETGLRRIDEVNARTGNTPLIRAILGGHVEVVRKLLGAYADVNAAASGWSPLSHACYTVQEEAVRMLVRAGARVDHQDSPARFSPLLLAACAGSEPIVRLLLKRGAVASATDAYGDTALVCACRNGHAAIVRLLLRAEAPDEQLAPIGLLEACKRGHTDVVQLLLDAWTTPANAESGLTPLMLAVAGGHAATARLLIDTGAAGALDATDRWCGWTALAHAAAAGHAGTVAALLDAGAASAADVEGNSPLLLAVAGLNTATAEELLLRGADVNRPNKEGLVPLFVPLMPLEEGEEPDEETGTWRLLDTPSEQQIAMALLMLRFAPDLKLQSKELPQVGERLNVLQLACWRGAVEVVEALLLAAARRLAHAQGQQLLVHAITGARSHRPLHIGRFLATVRCLLRYGANVNEAAPRYQMAAIHEAALLGNASMVELLLDSPEVKVDQLDYLGRSALGIAAAKGHGDVVRLLIAAGANAKHTDSDGDTPLIGARGSEVNRLLLDAQVDPDIANKAGTTALASAVKRRDVEAVKVLALAVRDIDPIDHYYKMTPLNIAIYLMEPGPLEEIARVLLRAGADPVSAQRNSRFLPQSVRAALDVAIAERDCREAPARREIGLLGELVERARQLLARSAYAPPPNTAIAHARRQLGGAAPAYVRQLRAALEALHAEQTAQEEVKALLAQARAQSLPPLASFGRIDAAIVERLRVVRAELASEAARLEERVASDAQLPLGRASRELHSWLAEAEHAAAAAAAAAAQPCVAGIPAPLSASNGDMHGVGAALRRDGNVLLVDSTHTILNLARKGLPAEALRALCVGPNTHGGVTPADFPIGSRGAPFPYRALAFVVPPALDALGEPHASLLVYFVHHGDRIEERQHADTRVDGPRVRPVFLLAERTHARRVKPHLYHYDSIGSPNFGHAQQIARVLCVDLRLFDAECHGPDDYTFEHVACPQLPSNACAVACAERIAFLSMRSNFGPMLADSAARLVDARDHDLASGRVIEIAKKLDWMETTLEPAAALDYWQGAVSSITTLRQGPRLDALARYLDRVYRLPWLSAEGKPVGKRGAFADQPFEAHLDPDFVRLYLAAEFAVPDDVVFVTSFEHLLEEWTAVGEAFRAAPAAARSLPRLFLWLHLPPEDAASAGPARLRPALVGFRPLYSRALGTARLSEPFVYTRDGANVRRYYEEFVEGKLLGAVGDFEPRDVAPLNTVATSHELLNGDDYTPLIELAKAFARMDGYVRPGGASTKVPHASGLSTPERDKLVGADTYTAECTAVRSAMYGRVMELLFLNAERNPTLSVPLPGGGRPLELGARSSVFSYSEVKPRNGVEEPPRVESALRRQWAFLYYNTALYDCIDAAAVQLDRDASALQQRIDWVPCCARIVRPRYFEAKQRSLGVVLEHWTELRSYVTAAGSSASAEWLASMGGVSRSGNRDRDAAALMNATLDADLLQFPVVVHGRALGARDELPTVLGLVDLLAALYNSDSFAKWMVQRTVDVGDLPTYPHTAAGVLSGPDTLHQDPFIHIVVDNYTEVLTRLCERLALLRDQLAQCPPLRLSLSTSAETPGHVPSLLCSSYASVALTVVSFLLTTNAVL